MSEYKENDLWIVTIQYSSGETKTYTTIRSIYDILLSAKQWMLKQREDGHNDVQRQ